MDAFMNAFMVALGGAAGALARYTVNNLVNRRMGTGWPYSTLLINLTGCLAIGIILTLAGSRARWPVAYTYLISTGFLGAYTTFSTFGYETVRLLEARAWLSAGLYVGISNLGGLMAVAAGIWLGRKI